MGVNGDGIGLLDALEQRPPLRRGNNRAAPGGIGMKPEFFRAARFSAQPSNGSTIPALVVPAVATIKKGT